MGRQIDAVGCAADSAAENILHTGRPEQEPSPRRRSRRLIDFAATTGDQALVSVCNFGVAIIAGRILGPAGFGLFTLIWSNRPSGLQLASGLLRRLVIFPIKLRSIPSSSVMLATPSQRRGKALRDPGKVTRYLVQPLRVAIFKSLEPEFSAHSFDISRVIQFVYRRIMIGLNKFGRP